MEKFNRTLHGYDPEEVNAFLDQVINHVEKMIADMKSKDERIKELENALKAVVPLKEKVTQYEKMEETLNKAIFMAQKTSDQIKSNAYRESELIVDEENKTLTIGDIVIKEGDIVTNLIN